ncbi:MAG: ROK family protein [Planctomycetaceae bacterium]|nr:ROK family protein [Planctomycetaceae bacterium]
MYLGIEIGGTKLQLGVGAGDGSPLIALERAEVDPLLGAQGILARIEALGKPLIDKHSITCIGIGFGGPVEPAAGRVTTSHQIAGWDAFPLVDWSKNLLGCETVLGNDCDVAALAEARFGAGKNRSRVFFVTVGTGVGGGFVIDGRSDGRGRPAIAEIGHLRVGLDAGELDGTVESFASGRGIERHLRQRLNVPRKTEDMSELFAFCAGDVESLTTKQIVAFAEEGNPLALDVWQQAVKTLGWGIAQVITLLAPEVVVVGGGVSLSGEDLFFAPLRNAVREHVFPPLVGSYEILPATLGEQVVIHGALALAACEGLIDD